MQARRTEAETFRAAPSGRRILAADGCASSCRPADVLPVTEEAVTIYRELAAAAPVVADALGFHQTTTTRQFTAAGGTWSRYAASRSPSARI